MEECEERFKEEEVEAILNKINELFPQTQGDTEMSGETTATAEE